MNSAQLESQSEIRREGVVDTLDELHARLTPGQLVDEALAYAKDGGGEFLSKLGQQILNNPLPVTLVGAGLAVYLFSNGKDSNGSNGSVAYGNPNQVANGANYYAGGGSTSNGPSTASSVVGAAAEMGSTVKQTAGEFADRVGDTARDGYNSVAGGLSSAAGAVSSAASSATDAIGSAASSATGVIGDAGHKAADAARSVTKTATQTGRDSIAFLKDQPLIMAGVGLALGAAIGAAFPSSEIENELMGETSDQVKDKAKVVASEQLDKAKDVGARLYDEVSDKAKTEVASLVDDLNATADELSTNAPQALDSTTSRTTSDFTPSR